MEAVIELKNVEKRFRDALVLQAVTVSFEPGKIHGIVGRNGSGKTVLFKCIVGFMPVSGGELYVRGKKLDGTAVPDGIGTIIEAPGFLPNYSGYQNLLLLAKIKNKLGKQEITDALRAVGLDAAMKKPVKKYSLGMRQRLGIAQAIMENPDILVLDEPFNGLDNEGVEEMRRLFLEMKERGKTILIASHNREDIEILCDKVYEMDKGILTERAV